MPQSKKFCFIMTWEGLGLVTKTLCTQKEANAFSLWNNNLGYQDILELGNTNSGSCMNGTVSACLQWC
jgi:hypothetical protein